MRSRCTGSKDSTLLSNASQVKRLKKLSELIVWMFFEFVVVEGGQVCCY